MKKITILIIASLFLFSSIFTANAQEGYMEQLLELNTGLEVYELSIPKMDVMTFSESSLQNTYNEFIRVDGILRNEFIRQYRLGELTYYQMRDIITNYSNYIYYTNRTFYYLRQKELGYDNKETQRAIKNGYSSMRTYYVRVKGVISKH